VSQVSNGPSVPAQGQSLPGRATRRLYPRAIIALVVLGVALLHAVGRIITGDIRGQFELAAILALLLFVALPVIVLARLLAKSRIGRFIRADPRTTALITTKRFKLQLQHDSNRLLMAQAFVVLLFLLILIVAAVATVIRWVTP
jgi:hypothetical protein